MLQPLVKWLLWDTTDASSSASLEHTEYVFKYLLTDLSPYYYLLAIFFITLFPKLYSCSK